MSQRSVISASIQANFPDNSTNFITPTRLRDEQYTFLYDAVLNEQTSSMNVASASYALTASFALNGGGDTGSFATTGSNTFKGDQTISGSITVTNTIKGTGSINLQPNDSDARYLEIYNTSPTDTHITASGGQLFLGDDQTYVKVDNYGSVDRIDIVAGNLINVSSSVQFTGSVQITGSLGVTGSILGSNEDGLVVNLGSGNTIPNIGANGNALAFGNNITNNSANNGFAFGDNHTIANPGYNDFIAGGNGNTINSNRSAILAGLTNTINNDDSVIIGGSSNIVNHNGAIILGGNGQTTIDDQTVHMNRANIGDWGSGNYVSFNNSGSNDVDFFATSLTINDNSAIYISGSTTPAVLRIEANNYLDLKIDADISTNFGGFTTGSSGQVLTRSGSSIVWATPSGGTVDTGSLATTGSNTFNGTNTFTGSVNIQSASITFLTVDTIVSSSTINNTGSNQLGDTASDTQTLFGTISLKEGNVYMSSGSLGTLWTGSAATQYPNIIFPRVGSLAQSGSAQFTGKNNILMTTGINVPGFSSSFNGNANVIAGGINWSGSTTPPNLNTTYLAGTIQVTGSGGANQVSSTQNNIIGSILVDLSKATGSNQPGFTSTNNVINGSLTVSSSISGSTTFNTLAFNNNNIAGGGHLIKAAGAGRTSNSTITNNFVGGISNTVSIEGASTAGTGITNALIYGSNLVYSGSSNANNSSSSVFVGQFNETGSLALDSQVRFAVGNGASTGSRSTPFYVSASGQTVSKGGTILSGSTLVSGSIVVTGSIVSQGNIDLAGAGNTTSGVRAANIAGFNNNITNINTGGTFAAVSSTMNLANDQGNAILAGNLNTLSGNGNIGTFIVGGSSNVLRSFDAAGPTREGRGGIIGGSSNEMRGTLTSDNGANANSLILGGTGNIIQGPASSSVYDSAILASSGSRITAASQSVIIGSDFSLITGSNNTIILGRNNITSSANNTTYVSNIDASGSVSISGSLRVNGNLQYNYGEFWMSSSQTPSAGVSQSVVFDSTGHSVGVAISGSGDLIKVTNGGTYNIQFSAQINANAGTDTMWMWFKKNGTNIAASNSKAVLANNTAQLITVNILDTATANDYYEIVYQNNAGNAQILSEAASGNYPSIPGVILTVTQVA
jgi:hypothetical protein